MALALPHSIFFHMGRTGGHCVRKAIAEMQIPTHEVGGFHAWPEHTLLDATEREKLLFCFVRHPLAWLKSFWCHQMQFGWTLSEYSSQLESDSFADFLAKSLDFIPDGLATTKFRPFVTQCREVGRQERLAEDLGRILQAAGERIDPAVLERIGPTGVEISRRIRDAATAPRALLEKVLEAERETCRRFGYSDIPRGMIGDRTVCVAPYVALGRSRQPLDADSRLGGLENAFLLDGERHAGPQHRRQTTMAIAQALEAVDFRGKDVIEVGCGDGMFCFLAEAKAAARVVGVTRERREVTTALRAALESKVEFVPHGLYGVEEAVDGKFDVVLCLRWLQSARHPLLLIRTLGRLLKEGGRLVLQCDYLRCCPGIPLMLCPLGSESPSRPEGCSYFNKEGLMNALSSYGFHDFVIHEEIDMGVDRARAFARLPFPGMDVGHHSQSAAGILLLSCRWSPAEADADPRYALDGVTGRQLIDRWDSELPSGLPQYSADSETLAHLRQQLHVHDEAARQMKAELASLQQTVDLLTERSRFLRMLKMLSWFTGCGRGSAPEHAGRPA